MSVEKCKNPGCENAAKTRKGFCSQSCWGSFRCKERNASLIGKTFVELYGEVRAGEIAAKMGTSISKKALETGFTKIGASVVGASRRGKSVEEIYGQVVGKRYRESARTLLQGKHYVEIYGVEGAKNKCNKMSRSLQETCATPEYSAVLAKNRAIGVQKFQDKYIAHDATHQLKLWSKAGVRNGIRWESTYEEALLSFLDVFVAAGYVVTRYPGTFTYMLGNKTRRVYPDFALYFGGKMVAILEAKGEHYLKNEYTYAKLQSMFDNSVSLGVTPCLFSKAFRHDFFYGNPDPSQRNSLSVRLQAMNKYLSDYLVRWKEQRLRVEDNEANKTLKDRAMVSTVPNLPHPVAASQDGDIVRFPGKLGDLARNVHVFN